MQEAIYVVQDIQRGDLGSQLRESRGMRVEDAAFEPLLGQFGEEAFGIGPCSRRGQNRPQTNIQPGPPRGGSQ